jgi:cation:H+ antiporter
MDYLLLFVGIALLAYGGELLVKGSVSLALRLQISTLVVGMTVVSFATSAPELLVSLEAALSDHPDISLGNVIGSNIANIGLVLGLTAVISPLAIPKEIYRTNYPMLLIVSVLFMALLYFFKAITFWMGILFVISLFVFGFLIIQKSRKNNAQAAQDDPLLQEVVSFPLWKSLSLLLAGAIALYFGADLLVESSVSIAREWGVTERVISLSLVAIGTSIPELAASIIAAIRKEETLAIGNLIGSNIFNVLAVLGITSLVVDIPVMDLKILSKDIWIMLAFALLLFPIMRFLDKNKINRVEGVLLFLAYTLYIYFL